MTIHCFTSGPFATNSYLVSCPLTRHAAIIDAAPDSADLIIQKVHDEALMPQKILLTHSHWDHIAEVSILKERFKIPVYVHTDDVPNLIEPGSDRLPCWIDIKGITPDHELIDGEEISVGSIKFRVMTTPGHSPGSVCFYSRDNQWLFSGDTLFQGTIGNLSFPTSVPNKMWDSLKRLAKLPKETQVYPGHGPSTTIGAESWLERAESVFGN